jgi:hypothetical protein
MKRHASKQLPAHAWSRLDLKCNAPPKSNIANNSTHRLYQCQVTPVCDSISIPFLEYSVLFSLYTAMETILEQATTLAHGASEATRKAIISQLFNLAYSLESPDDTVTRIWGLVSVQFMPVYKTDHLAFGRVFDSCRYRLENFQPAC